MVLNNLKFKASVLFCCFCDLIARFLIRKSVQYFMRTSRATGKIAALFREIKTFSAVFLTCDLSAARATMGSDIV